MFSIDKLTKYPITKEYDKAIYCKSEWGPIFGNGATIHIYDNFNETKNIAKNDGYNFDLPKTADGKCILTGEDRNFIISEIEVYSV